MIFKIKCKDCINSRAVLSENGVHYVCCLSDKKYKECLLGKKNYNQPVYREEVEEKIMEKYGYEIK